VNKALNAPFLLTIIAWIGFRATLAECAAGGKGEVDPQATEGHGNAETD
jgi:hypothetical protein